MHLDLKHDNIMLDHVIEPKLADFGFLTETHGQYVNLNKCTEEYAAPEVIMYKIPYDGKKADIHCLGVLFYSTLTCRYPDRQNVATRWANTDLST